MLVAAASPAASHSSCPATSALLALARLPLALRAMPHDNESDRGGVGWIRRWWRALLAELIATALLILLGVASLLPNQGQPPPLAHPALAFGLIVLANVEAFGAVSGAHMNPAVTVAALLDRRLPLVAALAYVISQVLGATLGFAALMGIAPLAFEAASLEVVVGGTAAGSVGVAAAAAVEALLTGVLALLLCGIWAAHDQGIHDPTVSIKVGLTITGLIYAGGTMTGASLNPARSFAPALLQRFKADHWVYWVGPVGGAALATLLHRHVLRRPLPARATASEALPLHDKSNH